MPVTIKQDKFITMDKVGINAFAVDKSQLDFIQCKIIDRFFLTGQ